MSKKLKISQKDISNIIKESITKILLENNGYDYDANYEELIRKEVNNLYELENNVPYAYRREIHSALTTLEGILEGIKRNNDFENDGY